MTERIPGPSDNQGIAARAIAMRNAQAGNAQVAKVQEEMRTAPAGTAVRLPTGIEPRDIAPPVRTPVGKLAGAIAGVMAEVGTINKGGFNKFHNYHYARMEDLLQVITPLMGKHGIAVFQSEVEVTTAENRIVVLYEFTVAHSSGETMIGRQRGMCIARNSKGDYDDKALNKCHTQARKYFLLGLFQVPAGDFDDSDPEDTHQRSVPGPGPKMQDITNALAAGKTVTAIGGGGSGGTGFKPQDINLTSDEAIKEGIAHKIVLGQGAGSQQWANKYLTAIGGCTTTEQLVAWEKANAGPLQAIKDGFPKVYDMIVAAVEEKVSQLSPAPSPSDSAMPDPKGDATEAMNWIASELQQRTTYEGGETFWNREVAPRETEFDPLDWDMLMQEWQRFETRFPQQDPPEAA